MIFILEALCTMKAYSKFELQKQAMNLGVQVYLGTNEGQTQSSSPIGESRFLRNGTSNELETSL